MKTLGIIVRTFTFLLIVAFFYTMVCVCIGVSDAIAFLAGKSTVEILEGR